MTYITGALYTGMFCFLIPIIHNSYFACLEGLFGKFSFPLSFLFFLMALCNCRNIMLPYRMSQEARKVVCIIYNVECLSSIFQLAFGFQLSQVHMVSCAIQAFSHVDARTLRKMCSVWVADTYIHKAGALSLMKLIIGVALVNKTSFFTALGTKGLFLPCASCECCDKSSRSHPAPQFAPTAHHAHSSCRKSHK
jgi:hypothetical protein